MRRRPASASNDEIIAELAQAQNQPKRAQG
jgi:hypothetical protein